MENWTQNNQPIAGPPKAIPYTILARKGFRSTRALNYPVYQRKPHLFQSRWINMNESTKPWQLYRKRKTVNEDINPSAWTYTWTSFCMNIHMNITDAGILEPELMKIWSNMNHSYKHCGPPPTNPPPDLPGTHGTPGCRSCNNFALHLGDAVRKHRHEAMAAAVESWPAKRKVKTSEVAVEYVEWG